MMRSCRSHWPPAPFAGIYSRGLGATLTGFLWEGSVHSAIRSRDWNLIAGPHGWQLYHIVEDPHEFKNLAVGGSAEPHTVELEEACLEETRLTSRDCARCQTEFERQDWSPLTM